MKNLVSVRAELKALAVKQTQLQQLELQFERAEEIQAYVNEGIKKYGNEFIGAVSNRFQALSGEQLKRYNVYKQLVADGFRVSGNNVIGRRGTKYNTQVLVTKMSKETKTTTMTQAEFIKIHNRYNAK